MSTLKDILNQFEVVVIPIVTIINDYPKVIWYVGGMETNHCFPEETPIDPTTGVVHIDNRYNERHLMEFLKSPTTAEFLSVEDALAWADSLAKIRGETLGRSSFMTLPAVTI